MGHTEQAAKDARRCCFEMLDYFGLNSLFLSTTPDDECSFRVRLYCKPQYWVRSIYSKMEFIVFFHVFTIEYLLFCNLFSCNVFIDIGCKRYNPKWNKSCCHLIIIDRNCDVLQLSLDDLLNYTTLMLKFCTNKWIWASLLRQVCFFGGKGGVSPQKRV